MCHFVYFYAADPSLLIGSGSIRASTAALQSVRVEETSFNSQGTKKCEEVSERKKANWGSPPSSFNQWIGYKETKRKEIRSNFVFLLYWISNQIMIGYESLVIQSYDVSRFAFAFANRSSRPELVPGYIICVRRVHKLCSRSFLQLKGSACHRFQSPIE